MSDAATQAGKRPERQAPIHHPGPVDNSSPESEVKRAAEAIAAKDAENARLRTENASLARTAKINADTAADSTIARVAEREATITTGIANATRARDTAQAAMKAAREAGNIDAEMAAQEQFIEAKTTLRVLDMQKTDFEAKKPQLLEEAKRTKAAPVSSASDVPAARQAWFDKHPKYFTDPAYNAKAMAGHYQALAENKTVDTPEYFAVIDKSLGETNEQHREARSTSDDGISTAAAPGRTSGRGYSSRDPEMQGMSLSYRSDGVPELNGNIPAAIVEKAGWNNMTPVEYAISLLEIEKENGSLSSMVAAGEGRTYR